MLEVFENFHFNFIPRAFNVALKIESNDFEIERTYGTPFDDIYYVKSPDIYE